MAGLGLELAADGGGGGSDLEEAEHVEAEDEHEQQQDDDDPRILELVAPAFQLRAVFQRGGADRVEDAAEDGKGGEHAERESDAMEGDGAPVFPGLLDKAHDLQPDDREHAGHEVEDQAAEEHAAEDGQEFGKRYGLGGRGGDFRFRDREGLGADDDAGDGVALGNGFIQHIGELALEDEQGAASRFGHLAAFGKRLDVGLVGDELGGRRIHFRKLEMDLVGGVFLRSGGDVRGGGVGGRNPEARRFEKLRLPGIGRGLRGHRQIDGKLRLLIDA